MTERFVPCCIRPQLAHATNSRHLYSYERLFVRSVCRGCPRRDGRGGSTSDFAALAAQVGRTRAMRHDRKFRAGGLADDVDAKSFVWSKAAEYCCCEPALGAPSHDNVVMLARSNCTWTLSHVADLAGFLKQVSVRNAQTWWRSGHSGCRVGDSRTSMRSTARWPTGACQFLAGFDPCAGDPHRHAVIADPHPQIGLVIGLAVGLIRLPCLALPHWVSCRSRSGPPASFDTGSTGAPAVPAVIAGLPRGSRCR
jgi:hypothetical protein